MAQSWISSRTLRCTSGFKGAPSDLSNDTKLSKYSREAISARKWVPPFLTHVSVNYQTRKYLVLGRLSMGHWAPTFNVASWMLGFRFSSRRFKDLIASLG